MVTMRIEFMDGEVSWIHFSMNEGEMVDGQLTVWGWREGVQGLVILAHKKTNRVVYPWANIRRYAIHNPAVKEYRYGSRPAEGQ